MTTAFRGFPAAAALTGGQGSPLGPLRPICWKEDIVLGSLKGKQNKPCRLMGHRLNPKNRHSSETTLKTVTRECLRRKKPSKADGNLMQFSLWFMERPQTNCLPS